MHWNTSTIILVSCVAGLLCLVGILFIIVVVLWRRLRQDSEPAGMMYDEDGRPLLFGLHPDVMPQNLYGALAYEEDDPYNDLRVPA